MASLYSISPLDWLNVPGKKTPISYYISLFNVFNTVFGLFDILHVLLV